jgi:hypothetical protein
VLRKRISLVGFCVWLALWQGCSHQTDSAKNLTLAHEISPQSPRVGQVTIALRLTDAAGTPVTGALMKLEGNMSHAGMVPVFSEAKEIEPGRYLTTLELSMAGDWHVLVTVTLPDKQKFERQFEIKEVAPI